MLIRNYSPALGRNSSSEIVHRPVVKVYNRSFVPTMSSLLTGVTERQQLSDHMETYIHSMEGQTERKGIPETSSSTDGTLYNPNSDYRTQCNFRSFGRSCRTEDIFVREDENGVRSHYCPFDRDRNGEINEENFLYGLTKEMDQQVNWMSDNSSLKSEEMPYLMAEKPSESDSEKSQVSDVDASTSMIYPPLRNQVKSTEEDSSLQLILQKGKKTPSFSYRLLDEETMRAWTDLYDDCDYDLYGQTNMGDISKYNLGDESDMEEFNEIPQIEKDKDKSEIQNDENIGTNLESDKSLENRVDEEMGNNFPSEDSERKEYPDKCAEERQQKNLDTKPTHDSEKEGKKDGKYNSDEGHSPPSSEDQKQMESLEAEVESAMLNATIKLNGLTEIQNNPWNISSDITEEIVVDHVTRLLPSAQDSDKINESIIDVENTNSYRVKSNVPNINSHSRTEKEIEDSAVNVSSKPETDEIANELKQPNEQKQSFLSMEPVVMKLEKSSKVEENHSDLATSLRFMTEVHIKRENDLYSDTLGNMDMSDEASLSEMPKMSTISDDYPGENPTENFINVKSQGKSRVSEPVTTEETRTGTRPQNKLTKFFKSFKKKLTKKS